MDQELVVCFLWSTFQNIKQRLGWKMSTFKSEVVVCCKGVDSLLQVGDELLSQVEKLKHLRVIFIRRGGVEQEENR